MSVADGESGRQISIGSTFRVTLRADPPDRIEWWWWFLLSTRTQSRYKASQSVKIYACLC